jgi:mannose-6-phosphate isomerase-like protein (cupin superfamily)
MLQRLVWLFFIAASLHGADWKVDPTWLHRYVPAIAVKHSDLSTDTCHYKPIFGAGDSDAAIPKSVARLGEVRVDPNGACATVSYAREEQIYVVLEGSGDLHYGAERIPIGKNDYMYLPAGVQHSLSSPSGKGCRVLVVGFNIPAGVPTAPPPQLLKANIDDVKRQTVEGHPQSVHYRLLLGDRESQRDKIAAGHVVTSLFLMDFAPGGTNHPHHHESAEEIYLILDGHGDMVLGGGLNGVEGRHPAKPGDAYFVRLNCTVGFYNSSEPGAKTRILAVRSRFPFGKNSD